MATKCICLALHFGISLISFSSVFVMTLIIFSVDQKYEADELFIKKPLRTLTWLMAIIVYLTIYTGALVRHTKSSLAYGAWPVPFNDIVPHNAHDWVQFAHRGMAFITFMWIMFTFIHAIKNYSDNRTVRYGYTAAFIFSYFTSHYWCIISDYECEFNRCIIPCIVYYILIRYDRLLHLVDVKNNSQYEVTSLIEQTHTKVHKLLQL